MARPLLIPELTCTDLDQATRALTSIGFRVESISPADGPRRVELSNGGQWLSLRRVEPTAVGVEHLVISGDQAAPDTGWPANWRLVCRTPDELELPAMTHELVVSRSGDETPSPGRAGMLYRDLLPSRHGGRYIASHISIPDGGPVPDSVHFHRIRFQLIFCVRGWARLVYQDQGDPFLFEAGDAILQPPELRHRVLESSAGFEVVELGCPAEHDTVIDHELDLPNGRAPGLRYGGQHFVWHRATGARHRPWRQAGLDARDTGIGAATDFLADVRVVRPAGREQPLDVDWSDCKQPLDVDWIDCEQPLDVDWIDQRDEFAFFFVLEGSVEVVIEHTDPIELACGDSISVPMGARFRLHPSSDLSLLEVIVRADEQTRA